MTPAAERMGTGLPSLGKIDSRSNDARSGADGNGGLGILNFRFEVFNWGGRSGAWMGGEYGVRRSQYAGGHETHAQVSRNRNEVANKWRARKWRVPKSRGLILLSPFPCPLLCTRVLFPCPGGLSPHARGGTLTADGNEP